MPVFSAKLLADGSLRFFMNTRQACCQSVTLPPCPLANSNVGTLPDHKTVRLYPTGGNFLAISSVRLNYNVIRREPIWAGVRKKARLNPASEGALPSRGESSNSFEAMRQPVINMNRRASSDPNDASTIPWAATTTKLPIAASHIALEIVPVRSCLSLNKNTA